VSLTVARNQLIGLTNKALGRDASFISAYITFSRCDGELNWDAALGIQTLDILDVFDKAVKQTREDFNIAW
jgi:hypothetical protein